MNKFSELQQSFFYHLRKLLDLMPGRTEDEVNDLLTKQADSEEEKKVFREICEEVDIEHKLKDELANSSMDSGEWLEREIENTTKELYPDATPEEIEMVKQKVEDGMEDEIGAEAESLEEEMTFLQFQAEGIINSKEGKEEQI